MTETARIKKQRVDADTTDSMPARERFFHFTHFPFCGPLKWFNSACMIIMQDGVELIM
jgi:hypothetical protein